MDWSSVQLRTLVELQRRGTLTAVAEVLGYTAGGVSQQLSALERAAGVALLRKVGRRVELTDAGTVLAAHARRILAIGSDATAALEHTAGGVTGTLRIALFASAAAEILPLMLARTAEDHPGLTLRCREMDVDDVYDAVSSGAVDLAVGLDYPDVPLRRDPSLEIVRLYRERFQIAAPRGLLPSTRPVDLAETAEQGWILASEHSQYGRAVRTVLRRAGVEPWVLHEVTDTAASMALVEAGVGISPVTDLMLRLRPSEVDVVRFREPFDRHIVGIVRASARARPTVATLLGVLGELTSEQVAGSTPRTRPPAGPCSPVDGR